MRPFALPACVLALLVAAGSAGAQPNAASWAAPQIRTVVEAGLMGPSTSAFRPDDALTAGELAEVMFGLGQTDVSVANVDAPVTIRELNARLVTVVGLRPEAREIRLEAVRVGLGPKQYAGTETVARLLGLRANHLAGSDERELQLSQPATRAEAAYSIARVLELAEWEIDAVRNAVVDLELPEMSLWRQTVLFRALRFVGSPYVWAGTSERPQEIFGERLPGGFDCSGLVWRVFKLKPFEGAPELAQVLRGRTTYDMSGEVPKSARLTRAEVQPGDVVFFGTRGPRSKPSEVGHMGIFVGDGWMVHSHRAGVTLQPMTGWYETQFAWGRSPLAEAGLD
jgi:cell wall-associated NlpC family hydrolase